MKYITVLIWNVQITDFTRSFKYYACNIRWLTMRVMLLDDGQISKCWLLTMFDENVAVLFSFMPLSNVYNTFQKVTEPKFRVHRVSTCVNRKVMVEEGRMRKLSILATLCVEPHKIQRKSLVCASYICFLKWYYLLYVHKKWSWNLKALLYLLQTPLK